MSLTTSVAIIIGLGLLVRRLISGRPLWFTGAAEVPSEDVATAFRRATRTYSKNERKPDADQ